MLAPLASTTSCRSLHTNLIYYMVSTVSFSPTSACDRPDQSESFLQPIVHSSTITRPRSVNKFKYEFVITHINAVFKTAFSYWFFPILSIDLGIRNDANDAFIYHFQIAFVNPLRILPFIQSLFHSVHNLFQFHIHTPKLWMCFHSFCMNKGERHSNHV